MAASPASDVGFFPREVPHRSGAFGHYNSPRKFYTGGGDIMTTLSPLTTIVPKSLDLP